MRSSGWSENERGGARCRLQSYAVVVDGEHPELVEERGNRRVREKRKEKMKREEREKGIYNNKIFATSVCTVANLQQYCSHVV